MTDNDHSSTNAIELAIKSRYPVIYVVTWEEERLVEQLREASARVYGDERPVWVWSAARGFLSGDAENTQDRNPVSALNQVIDSQKDALFAFLDLPEQFESNPDLIRAVRDTYDALSEREATLIMSHPRAMVPPSLGKEIHILDMPLPAHEEIQNQLSRLNDELAQDNPYDSEWLADCALAMQGLSGNEIRDLFRQLLSRGNLDSEQALKEIRWARGHALMKENCLEVIEDLVNMDEVGGLIHLKKWIASRHQLFSAEARDAGIKPPSGILMMGVSGCGKSLAAKTIPSAWNLPLIRLDMNLIMSGAWGSPETAWERAKKAAESAAPLVLWIDEIENCFGYIDDKTASGNLSIFSSFLTWMQEKPDDVFVAATANKIEMLPAEMIRKGRFDQLFFVDLPQTEARSEILKIHITNEGNDPNEYDIAHLAGLVEGWTAAEIEQMVKAARVDAFTEDRQFNYDDMIHNIFRTVPLSKTMAEQLDSLRKWSRKRATPAG